MISETTILIGNGHPFGLLSCEDFLMSSKTINMSIVI
ncbi:unnamed protein product [Brassica rapa subsp. trilocularis]